MKILHAAETIIGGVATVINQLSGIEEDGISQIYLVPLAQRDAMRNISDDTIFTFNRSGRNIYSLLRLAVKLIVVIKKHSPEIVHLHSSFAGTIGRIAIFLSCPLHPPKIVYSPHGWSFIMDNSFFKKKMYSLVERLLAPLTAKVICVSDYEKKIAVEYKIPPSKLAVVYNGVAPPSKTLHESPFSEGVINFIYVGRLDYAKGFDILLKAVAGLNNYDFHLTVIGSAVHSDLRITSRPDLSYTGWLPPEEIQRYYQHADFLVMPSRWEAFGLTAVEAYSYKLPVLASNCCSLPEIINDGVTGILFEKDSPEDLAEKIKATPRSKWYSFKDAAYDLYEKKFRSELMQVKTLNLYRILNSS